MPSDNPPTNPPPPWSEPETIVEERPAALIGEIALYSEKKIKSSKYRLVFVSLPPEVATRFPEAVTTTRTAPDVWQLQGRPGKGARVKQLTPTHYELYGGSTAPIIEGFAAPFRAQAEFVIAGSTVTARLLRETMHPLTPPPYRGGSKPKTAAPAPQAQSASPSPPATQERLPSFGEIAGMFVPGVADMHAALIQIREIERATPYRLVKLREDGWAWRAPMITLDAG